MRSDLKRRTHAVHDELNGECRKDDAEEAGEDRRPVTPRNRSIRSAITSARNSIAIDAAMTTMSCTRSSAEGNELPRRMVAEIAPGPAIRGSARGKTAILWRWSFVIAVSPAFSFRSWRFSKIISKAIQKSSMPPAIRKAPIEMPSRPRMPSPNSAKAARMKKAMSEPRVATWKRCCRLKPTVRLRKIGARPGGSSVTSSVVSALIKRSTSNIRVPFRILPRLFPVVWPALLGKRCELGKSG